MEDKKEASNFLLRIVKPHPKISREVKKEDVPRVVEEANILFNLCFTQNGPYAGALAMAHPQIDSEDPLRFFVTAEKDLIINPVINNHTKTTVDSIEGCATFSHLPPKIVQRWNKVDVSFQTLMTDPNSGEFVLSELMNLKLSGRNAKIFQHERDHLDGIYIYPYEQDNK